MPLFEGTHQYARYSSRMLKLYKEVQSDLTNIGIDYCQLGSHSARKGVGTMVASGCTVGPPIVPLCLRAGWTLGGVKDKYLFRENAGDMFVGQCASGHDTQVKEFAISPASFDYSHLELQDKIQMKKRVEDHLSSCLPHMSDIEPNAWNLAKYCFAAICYSYNTLNDEIHDECPLRTAAVFRDIPEDIVKLAVTKFPWNKTNDTPKATGLPPYSVQLAKLEELEQTVDSIPTRFLDMMKTEMDNRKFFSTEHNTSEITNAIKAMSEKIVKDLMEQTNICKRAAISETTAYTRMNSVSGLVMENKDDNNDWCEEQLTVGDDDEDDNINDVNKTAEEEQLILQRARNTSSESVKRRKLKVGYHHGKLNPLPKNWKFSSMTSLMLIQNWFIGDLNRNIPPLCILDSKNVAYFTKGNNVRCKMAAFMRIVEAEAREKEDVWLEKLGDWEYRSITRMWNVISADFKAKYCATKRKKELSWSTVYNKMTQANALGNKRNTANK